MMINLWKKRFQPLKMINQPLYFKYKDSGIKKSYAVKKPNPLPT